MNISKTDVQRIACDDGPVRTVIDNTPLKKVDKFMYLGETMIDKDMDKQEH